MKDYLKRAHVTLLVCADLDEPSDLSSNEDPHECMGNMIPTCKMMIVCLSTVPKDQAAKKNRTFVNEAIHMAKEKCILKVFLASDFIISSDWTQVTFLPTLDLSLLWNSVSLEPASVVTLDDQARESRRSMHQRKKGIGKGKSNKHTVSFEQHGFGSERDFVDASGTSSQKR